MIFRNKIFLLLISIFSCLQVNVLAQNFNFYSLGIPDGLSSSFVIDIFQDKKGVMWFSTQGGASSYDGTKFRTLRHLPGDTTTIPQNNVRSIIQDANGMIWMATFGDGLVKYNPVTERLKTYINPFSKSANRIHRLVEDSYGKIWIASEGSGLHCFDPKKETFSFFDPNPNEKEPLPRRQLRNLAIDSHGVLWVATRYDGFYSYNPKINKWTLYNNLIEGGIKVPSNRITYIHCSKSGKVLVTGETSLCVINSANGNVLESIDLEALVQQQITDFIAMTAMEDSYGRWWIGTNKGLVFYDKNQKTVQFFNQDPLVEGSISDSRILSLYEDAQKNIWVGTWNAGVNVTPQKGTRFSKIIHHPLNKNSLTTNNTLMLTSDPLGNIWASSFEHGISKYDPKSKKHTHFRGDTTNRYSLHSDRVWALYTDKFGMIWSGGSPGGLHKIDPKTNKVQKIMVDINEGRPLTKAVISAIFQDKTGAIWLGTFSERALLKYDEKTNSITKYPIFLKGDSSAASATQIYTITSSPSGHLWISTNGAGLIQFNPKDGSYQFFQANNKDQYGLNANKIGQIYCDKQGILWVLTLDAGLQCMNTQYPGTFATLTPNQGLLDINPQALIEDDFGYFWLSSSGITRFKRPQVVMKRVGTRLVPVISPLQDVHQYTKEFGITNNFLNATAVAKTKDGAIYFGGEKGITFFNSRKVDEKNIPANVYITNISVFGKALKLDTSLFFKRYIQLKYDQNFIDIEFSASDYTVKSSKTYQYQLVGLDAEWVSSNSSQVASYTNLEPGKYQFKVRELSIDGVWSAPATIYLSIQPPFWKTLWFYLLTVILIISIIVLIVKQRIQRIRKEEQKKSAFEREKIELELKALRAQMNPHFLFNALTSIEKFILDNQSEKAASFLTDFAKLIRAILENSREEKVSLEKELDVLERYIRLEQIRFKNAFKYKVEIEKDIDMYDTEIPPMLIQPIVENAIIHGLSGRQDYEGKLKIMILKEGNSAIKIAVEDNGSGRKIDTNKTNRSFGMSITNDRLQQLNRSLNIKESIRVFDLKNDFGEASGTRVDIILYIA
jgi:ligand-binding sensor domain-containing protein/two-component sensor histidine kinase